MIKYGPPELITEFCHTMNTMNAIFEEHTDVDIERGLLAPLPKPGKPKEPLKNLRPVILLPTLRRIMSGITLTRLRNMTEKYIPASRSAYRACRSTTYIVWSLIWILAKVQTVNITEFVTGIDITSAFDTIEREECL